MHYTEQELIKLKSVELEILEEIKRVCNKYQISWFTVGGTTLGAIRHNGFIPWDDDIDIGMLRSDYNKFLAIAPNELRKDYVLQCFETDQQCPTYFAKVRKNNTEFREEYAKELNINHGIFVDVMPFDKVSQNIIIRKMHFFIAAICMNLYIAKIIPSVTYSKCFVRTVCGNIVRRCLNIILKPCSRKKIFSLLDRCITYFNNSNSNTISSRCLDCFVTRISDYFPCITHKFENTEVYLPKYFDRILAIQYGEYMTLPPEKKRYTHKPANLKLD